MLKPNRYFTKTKEPCKYVEIKHLIDKKFIISVLIDELQYKKPEDDEKLTRAHIEKELRSNLRCSGEDWFEREEHNPDYVFGGEESEERNRELKQRVFKLATKLFPDWFPPPTSVGFIKSLAKE